MRNKTVFPVFVPNNSVFLKLYNEYYFLKPSYSISFCDSQYKQISLFLIQNRLFSIPYNVFFYRILFYLWKLFKKTRPNLLCFKKPEKKLTWNLPVY